MQRCEMWSDLLSPRVGSLPSPRPSPCTQDKQRQANADDIEIWVMSLVQGHANAFAQSAFEPVALQLLCDERQGARDQRSRCGRERQRSPIATRNAPPSRRAMRMGFSKGARRLLPALAPYHCRGQAHYARQIPFGVLDANLPDVLCGSNV